jgi:hypothetical protein
MPKSYNLFHQQNFQNGVRSSALLRSNKEKRLSRMEEAFHHSFMIA